MFVVKGWRKNRDLRASKTKLKEKQKELYETQAGAIRNIAIAKAEIERLRENVKERKEKSTKVASRAQELFCRGNY